MQKQFFYILPHKNYFFQGEGGAVTHAIGILKGLKKNGIKIKLVADSNGINNFEEINNVLLIDLNQVKGFKRYNKIIQLMNENRNSIFIIRKHFLFLLFYSIIVRSRYNVIWEINGLSFEKFDGKPVINILYKFLMLVNKILLKSSKGKIYTITPKLKEILATGIFALKNENIVVIENGCSNIKEIEKVTDKTVTFLFYGKFNYYNDYDLVIKAFNVIQKKEKNIKLLFVGFGPYAQRLKEMISINGNKSIQISSPANINVLYNKFVKGKRVFGLIPMKNLDSLKYTSPIKLYDYSGMNIPIIHSSSTFVKSKSKAFFEYDAKSYISLAEKMGKCINIKNYNELQNISHTFAKNNSWGNKMKILIDFIQNPEC